MTNALDTYNKCIAALHLTCQIANEYDVRLWHIVEEEVPASHADLDSVITPVSWTALFQRYLLTAKSF